MHDCVAAGEAPLMPSGEVVEVDLVGRGFKTQAHPKLEVYRRRSNMLHRRDMTSWRAERRAVDATVRWSLTISRRWPDILVAKAAPLDTVGRGCERLMAQLTDDCFAFCGPLLEIDDVERLSANA